MALKTVACVLLMACGVPAVGQVVTPPGESAPPTREMDMPEPAPPPSAREAPSRSVHSASEFDYEPLAKKTDDGRIAPLDMPADWAALDANPTIGKTTRANVDELMEQRVADWELVCVGNLEAVRDARTGIIEEITIQGQGDFQTVHDLLKPLIVQETVGEYLYNRRAFSVQQKNLNNRIAQEYHSARIKEIQESGTLDELLRYTMRMSIEEAMAVYDQLLLETAARLPGALDGLDLEGSQRQDVETAAGAVMSAKTDEGRIDAMRKMTLLLSVEQERALLESTIAAR